MRSFSITLALSIAVGALAIVTAGCHSNNGASGDAGGGGIDMTAGSDDLGLGGAGGCGTGGATCAVDGDCCSNSCDATSHVCALGQCLPTGSTCATAADCCNLNCSGGTCGADACVSDGQACGAGGDACCSTAMRGRLVQAAERLVQDRGQRLRRQRRLLQRELRRRLLRRAVDGLVLHAARRHLLSRRRVLHRHLHHRQRRQRRYLLDDPDLVPRRRAHLRRLHRLLLSYCGPFGTGTTKVCQPASGCHVLGDLCTKDTDCCGGDAPSGLPGAGLVKCTPDPNHPSIGTCSMANPNNCPNGEPTCKNTCQPEGDVCHFLGNGGCSSNSFPNNCCGATGNKGACQLDKLGVPRCYGIAACVPSSGTCASSADCCNGVPCVPDGTGHLHCGAMSCVPSNGTCTTTADCCAGGLCSVPPGSTTGSCVAPPVPDMGTMSMCAFSGQACTTTTPCCTNNGNCEGPTGAACTAGESDCICTILIQ